MPQTTIKLVDGDDYWYLEWSTVTDTPISHGMSWSDYSAWYTKKYGEIGFERLLNSQERLETTGIAGRGWGKDVDEVLEANRAGDDETEATKAEIIQMYCRDV